VSTATGPAGLGREAPAELAAAIRDIAAGTVNAGGDLGDEQIGERLARAMWTSISEPGDAVTGVLIGALGAADALDAVLDLERASTYTSQSTSQRTSQRIVDRVTAVAGGRDIAGTLTSAQLDAALERWEPRLDVRSLTRAVIMAQKIGARLLVPEDDQWPSGLDDLGAHAPIALWVRGDPQRLQIPGIAVVGARASSGYGEHIGSELAAGLAERGFAIHSGGAYGIDGAAHRAALAANGTTVAFMAGGVDRLYPSGHESLLTRVAETGAVVSELVCGATPTRWRFLQRNRLIAAASAATVVVEAGHRSGSLNTAAHAASLGRPLGAVPGPVTSAASAGCHRLLREFDAVCVTGVDDVAELAGGPAASTAWPEAEGAPPRRSDEELRVLDFLSTRSPRTLEDLARRAGVSLAEASSALGLLGIEGAARETASGWLAVPRRSR